MHGWSSTLYSESAGKLCSKCCPLPGDATILPAAGDVMQRTRRLTIEDIGNHNKCYENSIFYVLDTCAFAITQWPKTEFSICLIFSSAETVLWRLTNGRFQLLIYPQCCLIKIKVFDIPNKYEAYVKLLSLVLWQIIVDSSLITTVKLLFPHQLWFFLVSKSLLAFIVKGTTIVTQNIQQLWPYPFHTSMRFLRSLLHWIWTKFKKCI